MRGVSTLQSTVDRCCECPAATQELGRREMPQQQALATPSDSPSPSTRTLALQHTQRPTHAPLRHAPGPRCRDTHRAQPWAPLPLSSGRYPLAPRVCGCAVVARTCCPPIVVCRFVAIPESSSCVGAMCVHHRILACSHVVSWWVAVSACVVPRTWVCAIVVRRIGVVAASVPTVCAYACTRMCGCEPRRNPDDATPATRQKRVCQTSQGSGGAELGAATHMR